MKTITIVFDDSVKALAINEFGRADDKHMYINSQSFVIEDDTNTLYLPSSIAVPKVVEDEN